MTAAGSHQAVAHAVRGLRLHKAGPFSTSLGRVFRRFLNVWSSGEGGQGSGVIPEINRDLKNGSKNIGQGFQARVHRAVH